MRRATWKICKEARRRWGSHYCRGGEGESESHRDRMSRHGPAQTHLSWQRQ